MKSQAKKILFVLTQGQWGGAQKYVFDLASNLGPEFDIHIAIGTDDTHIFRDKIQENSLPITLHVVKHLKREISPFHDICSIFELKSLYKTLRPDIIHLNSSKAGIVGSLARIKHSKILYTVHGWVFLEPLSPWRKTFYQMLEKYTASKKDAFIVLSPQEFEIAEKRLKIPRQKIFLIPLGIQNISFFPKSEARVKLTEQNHGLNAHSFWFGTIANHYYTKGLDLLIEAISQIKKENHDEFQCLIIGDGPEKKLLENIIHEHRLEKTVFLLPFLPQAAQYLLAFDAFVLPSRKEGLPYSLLEAKQAGLPCIATNVGGVSTLTTQKDLLIEPENTTLLKEALLYSLEQKTNFSKEEFSFSLSKMIDKTKKVYQSFYGDGV